MLINEIIFVGFFVVIIGLILANLTNSDLNNKWNYGVNLFLIGAITHILCEVTGINKYYCVNGAACKKML